MQVDWNKIPLKFNYFTINSTGYGFAHKHLPRLNIYGTWVSEGKSEHIDGDFNVVNYEISLQKRPLIFNNSGTDIHVNWDLISSKFNYFAINVNEDGYVFNTLPKLYKNGYWGNGSDNIYIGNYSSTDFNTSLQKRPSTIQSVPTILEIGEITINGQRYSLTPIIE